MNDMDIGQTLRALTPTPPRLLSADAVLWTAGGRRRRGLALLTAGAFSAACVLGLSVAATRTAAPLQTAVMPPPTVSVEGVMFVRRAIDSYQPALGIKRGDPRAVFVAVAGTDLTKKQCATHEEAVIASQTRKSVTVAMWRYTPQNAASEVSCSKGSLARFVSRQPPLVRLALRKPLGQRQVRITGRPGTSPVLVLSAQGEPVEANLAPPNPDSARICLAGSCTTVTDKQLLAMSAQAINSAVEVRPGRSCSDAGRTDNVHRTYDVRFFLAGHQGPAFEVPLGCTPIRVAGGAREFTPRDGGPDVVRIAYDQQITPANQCMGIGGPSGGPVTQDYVGLTLRQAQVRAELTKNDFIRIAGRNGTCAGIVRDHVINRVNVYLEHGVVTASKSF